MTTKPIPSVRLLVVSSDSAILQSIRWIGEPHRWQPDIAANAWEAMDKIQSGVTLDLILLDLPKVHSEALHILRWLRRLRPMLPILLIGHSDDAYQEQELFHLGASEYLTRPVGNQQLETAIQRNLSTWRGAADTYISGDHVELIGVDRFFIGISRAMRKLRTQAGLLAKADMPVLILGEEGSGKETTARLIHYLSVRSGFRFRKVACNALPEDLLERELLGHETSRSAAPAQGRAAKVELRATGTILIDAIAEMPQRLQSRLLDMLKTERLLRPGSCSAIEADVRVLVASSTDLESAVSEGRLNADLYNHLTAYTIHVPPLRERREEIPFLARHCMHRLAIQYGLPPREYPPAILQAWQAYHWPGNLRELNGLVKRYLMVGDTELTFDEGRPAMRGESRRFVSSGRRSMEDSTPASIEPAAAASGAESLRSLLHSVKSEAERNAIAMALQKTGWNRKAAARLLKVSYRTILYKIEEYRIAPMDSDMRKAGHENKLKPRNGGRGATASNSGKVASL